MSEDKQDKSSFAYAIGYMFFPLALVGALTVGVTCFIGGCVALTGLFQDDRIDFVGAGFLMLVSALSFGVVTVVLGTKR